MKIRKPEDITDKIQACVHINTYVRRGEQPSVFIVTYFVVYIFYIFEFRIKLLLCEDN